MTRIGILAGVSVAPPTGRPFSLFISWSVSLKRERLDMVKSLIDNGTFASDRMDKSNNFLLIK